MATTKNPRTGVYRATASKDPQVHSDTAEVRFKQRADLLEATPRTESPDGPVIAMEELTTLMRSRSETHQHLSAIYFAGTRGDHPYFLKSDHIAIGISVLPQDAEKAGRAKLHPHQTELIVCVQGQLLLHTKNGEGAQKHILHEGEHHLIEAGTCHWVTPRSDAPAAYVFVKTKPKLEPKERDC